MLVEIVMKNPAFLLGLELRAEVGANSTLELWVLSGTRWGVAR